MQIKIKINHSFFDSANLYINVNKILIYCNYFEEWDFNLSKDYSNKKVNSLMNRNSYSWELFL